MRLDVLGMDKLLRGGAVIWPLLIGPACAKEFLMRGHLANGAEAAKIGPVNYAVPLEELAPKAEDP